MGQTFEELIGFHLDELYSAALCFTLDEHKAEELLQEASIRAFHELPPRGHAEDFRLAMLDVLVSTYLQRQRRQGHDPLREEPAKLEKMMAAAPHQRVEPFPEPGTPGFRLLVEWMSRMWTDLAAGDRLILWLADIERIRHRRIAEMVSRPKEEVRARHYRARLALSHGAAQQLGRRETGTADS
jgi:DNA-directed RNA polymerase specialized sigma24 family protein